MVIEDVLANGKCIQYELADDSAVVVKTKRSRGKERIRCQDCLDAEDTITGFNVPSGREPVFTYCESCGERVQFIPFRDAQGSVSYSLG